MGANASSQRQKWRRSQSGQHHYYYTASSRHSATGAGGGSTHGAGRAPPSHQHHSTSSRRYHHNYQQQQGSRAQQQDPQSRYTSVGTLNTMASTSSSQRRNAKSASTRTLLDKKCVFLGRYFARQFSQPVLQRLRYHVQHAKGTKTRIRLSTKGLTVGSKNNNLFKSTKAPYEFLPLDDIHDIFVDNDLRSVLLVIKGLPDGHLELLTYKLTDELEARLYQQTFNEMVSINGNRAGAHHFQRVMETSVVDGTLRSSGGTQLRGGGSGNHYHSTTLNSGSYNRRAGNSWSRTTPSTEGFVYRIKTDDYGSAPGTPSSRRGGKPRHRSEGDALDVELRRQAEDREFLQTMRRRDLNDNVHGELDDPDGPIRLVFSKDGIIEQHGAASIIRGDGEESFIGSDHDSGIQSKDNGNPDIVDAGVGTVRAQVSGYTATRSSSSSHSRVMQDSTSFDQTDDAGYHGNGYVSSGRASRSPTRAASSLTGDHVTHQVLYADRSRGHAKRSESPAPSHQSRGAQSEGGWRTRMPWKRRSRSSDSNAGHHWETTSLMVGSHPKPMGKMYFPKDGEKPPEYIVMYPTLNKNHRTKSKSASRFEL